LFLLVEESAEENVQLTDAMERYLATDAPKKPRKAKM
jgi:hypothetical protein